MSVREDSRGQGEATGTGSWPSVGSLASVLSSLAWEENGTSCWLFGVDGKPASAWPLSPCGAG